MNSDTNTNSQNNENVHVTTRVVQIKTINTNQNKPVNNNTQVKYLDKKKIVRLLSTEEESHDLKSVSNLHDDGSFRELNNSLEYKKNHGFKSFLITVGSLIGVALLIFFAIYGVNFTKKVYDYFNPTEPNYVKIMTNKLKDKTKLRILASDTRYFIFFPDVSKLNSNYVVRLEVYDESLSSKMETVSYNEDLDLFFFYGDEYKITKTGADFNGLKFILDEKTTASMYKYEDENELSFVLLITIKGKEIAIYFKNANSKVENINGFVIRDDNSIKLNEDLVFNKSNNALYIGEKKLTRVV